MCIQLSICKILLETINEFCCRQIPHYLRVKTLRLILICQINLEHSLTDSHLIFSEGHPTFSFIYATSEQCFQILFRGIFEQCLQILFRGIYFQVSGNKLIRSIRENTSKHGQKSASGKTEKILEMSGFPTR